MNRQNGTRRLEDHWEEGRGDNGIDFNVWIIHGLPQDHGAPVRSGLDEEKVGVVLVFRIQSEAVLAKEVFKDTTNVARVHLNLVKKDQVRLVSVQEVCQVIHILSQALTVPGQGNIAGFGRKQSIIYWR